MPAQPIETETNNPPRISKRGRVNEGRPPIVFDWHLLDQLLSIFCTGEECAAVMNVDYDLIERSIKKVKRMSFTEYANIKKGNGRASLRRRQFRMAETNPALAIWLGKQYLGQRDEQTLRVEGQIDHFFELSDAELTDHETRIFERSKNKLEVAAN